MCWETLRVLAALLLAMTLASVVSASEHMAPPASQERSSFTLVEDTVFQHGKNIKGNPVQFKLAKGTYALVRSERSGNYYLGPGRSYLIVNIRDDGGVDAFQGGLWIPSNEKKESRLWMYAEVPNAATMRELGPILAALSKLEVGRMRKVPGGVLPDVVDALKFEVAISQEQAKSGVPQGQQLE